MIRRRENPSPFGRGRGEGGLGPGRRQVARTLHRRPTRSEDVLWERLRCGTSFAPRLKRGPLTPAPLPTGEGNAPTAQSRERLGSLGAMA